MANKENISLLSKYQMKVLYYKCKEGATHEEIAQKLGREVNTVQYHMTKIYKILEISEPGKSKEELDSELKNEICPIIRQMFRDFDDVKLWAPSIKKTQNEIEVLEEAQDTGEIEDLIPSYLPPPSVEKVLKQAGSQVTPPEIIESPPPGRPRINLRQIILFIVIGLIIFVIGRLTPPFSAILRDPTNTPVQQMSAKPLFPTDPTLVSISRPIETDTFAPPTEMPIPTETLIPTVTPIQVVTEISAKDGMVLVFVPAGEFKMGSSRTEDPQTLDEELPQHIVYLDDYLIDRFEVTNAQYAMCVTDAGACTKPHENFSLSRSLYYGDILYDNYPVIFVSFSQAEAYCNWAGRRLPSEAEWEKAARGPEGSIFPWGNVFDGAIGNYCDINCVNGWKDDRYDDGYIDTSPVGDYLAGASVYGALDMAGNVYEWVADWYGPYNRNDQVNPTGPGSGQERIIRGGSWGDDPGHVRSAVRSHLGPDNWMNFIGFRCAQ
jgi:formylglycine-generating enzyme required for sulfatase activity